MTPHLINLTKLPLTNQIHEPAVIVVFGVLQVVIEIREVIAHAQFHVFTNVTVHAQ